MASDNELRPRKTIELIDESLRELEMLTGYRLLGDAGRSDSGIFLAHRSTDSSANSASGARPADPSRRNR